MDTIIRHATEEDLQYILEITNHAILHSTAIYDYDARTLAMQEDWYKKRLDANMPVIVAEQHAQVVGYGSYGAFRPKVAYQFSVEHSIYVAEHLRGHGIGNLLMTELIFLAKKAGFHSMIAGIDAANQGSYNFHQKFGFMEVGRFKEVGYKFDRWLDLIFMQLFL